MARFVSVALAALSLTGCAHYAIHHDAAGHCWEERDDNGERHFVRWLPADKCKEK